MNTKRFAISLALVGLSTITAATASDLPRSPAPKDVELYIISPADGETVTNPVTVRNGLRGMGIAPAGVALQNTGHHHLLIDADPPVVSKPVTIIVK